MAVPTEVCVLWPPELQKILVEQAAASELGDCGRDRYSRG